MTKGAHSLPDLRLPQVEDPEATVAQFGDRLDPQESVLVGLGEIS
jgi:hypothetical protein